MSYKVSVETIVYPTEELLLVKEAVKNIFEGNLVSQKVSDTALIKLAGSSNQLTSLNPFKEILIRDNIRAAAQKVLSKSICQNKMVFYVNKQVAYAGHISFCDPERESPLGPIKITISGGDLMYILEWLQTIKPEEDYT